MMKNIFSSSTSRQLPAAITAAQPLESTITRRVNFLLTSNRVMVDMVCMLRSSFITRFLSRVESLFSTSMSVHEFLKPLMEREDLNTSLLQYLEDTWCGGEHDVAGFVSWVLDGESWDGVAETDEEFEERRAIATALRQHSTM